MWETGRMIEAGAEAVADLVPSAGSSGADEIGGGVEAGAGDISRRFETPKGRPPYGIKWEEPTVTELQRWEGIWHPAVVGGRREVPAVVISPVVPFRWARVRALGGGEDVAEVDEYGYTEAESNRCLSVADREVEGRIATAVESFYLSTENHGYVFDYRDGS